MLITLGLLFDLIGKLSEALDLLSLLEDALRKQLELAPQAAGQIIASKASGGHALDGR